MIKLGQEVWWINEKNIPENGNVCYIVDKKVSNFNLPYSDYSHDYIYVFMIHGNKTSMCHKSFFHGELFKTKNECIAQIVKNLLTKGC